MPLPLRAVALLASLALLAPAAAHARPNVVVIETDDQTAADIASMPITRALIGDRGTTFRTSVVSQSQCCPSRATALTGRYSHNHGVLTTQAPQGGFAAFDDDETLAVWLQRAGYTTALVGKYLNQYGADDPAYVPPGWDDWHALLGGSTYRFLGFTLNENGRLDHHPGTYQTDELTRIATDVIRRRAAGARPFFLWTTYVAPHVGTPHGLFDVRGLKTTVPSPSFALAYLAGRLPRGPSFDEADMSDKPRAIRRRPRITRARFGRIQRAWRQRQASLQSVDQGVRRIVDALRDAGVLDDTVILFTSDNGFLEGQHRIPTGKVWPYEPSIRVPLLMRGPGVPAGVTRDALVANTDLAPTVLDLTGARPAWEPDGESLLPVARGAAGHRDRAVVLEGPPVSSSTTRRTFLGLRTPTHTYVEHATGEVELYDLRRDPGQLVNLRDPVLRERLHRRLRQLQDCRGQACRG